MNNLKKLRTQLGLNQKDFAAALHVNAATYNNYESGARDPRSDFWREVANRYGVSVDFLLGLTDSEDAQAGVPISADGRQVAIRYDRLDEAGQGAVKAILSYAESVKQQEPEAKDTIVYYLVPPAAGYAQPIEGSDYEIIPRPADAPANADFCLTVSGDSMEPYIHDRQMIYVKRDAPLREFELLHALTLLS